MSAPIYLDPEGDATAPHGVVVVLTEVEFLQAALDIAHISVFFKGLRHAVPARIECQRISLEHTLEQADEGIAVLQDQPVLRDVTAKLRKTELLVEVPRSFDIFYRQTD